MFSNALPPGTWLIKWIDRVHVGVHALAPKTEIALQLLPGMNAAHAQRLSADAVSSLIGYSADRPVQFRTEQLFAGQVLPQLRVGDLVEGKVRVGHLPQRNGVMLRLNADTVSGPFAPNEPREAPPGWMAP